MSEFKGTPGEWSAEQFGSQIQVWSKADTSVVCVVGNMGCTSNDRQTAKTQTGYAKANARLIAAAPELLEAHEPNAHPSGPDFLEFIADRLVLHGDNENADFVLALRRKASKARAAIAKATEG